MSKNCPKCGKTVPDDAKFCMDCGYSFQTTANSNPSGLFANGKIFLVAIAIVVVLGLVLIATTGNNTGTSEPIDDVDHVDLTISAINGYDSSGDKKSYTLYTEAIFNSVPDDMKGYNVKTTYYDANGTKIGSETETLDNVYYDSSYPLMFGYYTTYKLPDPDHVTVEILKGGKVVDSYTEDIDTNKIDYLN